MIYTAITNNYDNERNDIKCFTEDMLNNPRLSAKKYKVLSHLFDSDEWSIWVDGLKFLSEEQQKQLIKEVDESGKDIGLFKHPWRDCIYAEAQTIIRLNLDDKTRVEKQIERYRAEGYPDHNGLFNCSILVRRHTESLRLLNEKWWEEICNGSIRDQLSFPYVFRDCYVFKGDAYRFHRGKHLKSRNWRQT